MSEVADYKILALEQEVKNLREEVKTNHDMIQQLRGAGLFLKLCFIIAGPLAALIIWARHHINF